MKLALLVLLPIVVLLGAALLLTRKDRLTGANATRSATDSAVGSAEAARRSAVPPAGRRIVAPRQPVQVGGARDQDACPALARVGGRGLSGIHPLAVRAAPDRDAPQLDRLGTDAEVHMCDSAGGGAWIGIVYAETGRASARCGVSTPIARRRSYAGPCRSGWVAGQSLVPLAG